MTFSYTQNTPNANDTIAKTQPIIKNNFNYLRTWGIFDHRFPASTSDVLAGAHNKITYPANIDPAPALGTAFAILFPSNANGFDSLAFRNAAGSYNITGRNPSVPASPGQIETCLPGNLLMKCGIITQNFQGNNSNTGETVNFSSAFPNSCRNVSLTPFQNIGDGIGSGFSFTILAVTLSTSSFTYNWINRGSDSTTVRGFYWTAIGT